MPLRANLHLTHAVSHDLSSKLAGKNAPTVTSTGLHLLQYCPTTPNNWYLVLAKQNKRPTGSVHRSYKKFGVMYINGIITQPLYKWPIVARVHPVTPPISRFLVILPWAINYHCSAFKPFFFSMGVGVFPQLYVYFFYSCGGKPPLPSGLSAGGEARLAHFHQRFRRAHPILQKGTRYVEDIGRKQTITTWFEDYTLGLSGGGEVVLHRRQNQSFSRERPPHKLKFLHLTTGLPERPMGVERPMLHVAINRTWTSTHSLSVITPERATHESLNDRGGGGVSLNRPRIGKGTIQFRPLPVTKFKPHGFLMQKILPSEEIEVLPNESGWPVL